jgi:hypothetical protein
MESACPDKSDSCLTGVASWPRNQKKMRMAAIFFIPWHSPRSQLFTSAALPKKSRQVKNWLAELKVTL